MRWLNNKSGSCVAACLIAALAVMAPRPALAQPDISREYRIKAAFLFNFTQFVDWPPRAFADANAPFVIGILGDDPFGTFLDDIVRGESVDGRDVVVERYSRMEDVRSCHILFIHRSETPESEGLFPDWRQGHTLTVSDAEGFAQRGGTIGFSTVENKIRLTVNLEAAKASGLTIRSQLLRAVELVNTSGIVQ